MVTDITLDRAFKFQKRKIYFSHKRKKQIDFDSEILVDISYRNQNRYTL